MTMAWMRRGSAVRVTVYEQVGEKWRFVCEMCCPAGQRPTLDGVELEELRPPGPRQQDMFMNVGIGL